MMDHANILPPFTLGYSVVYCTYCTIYIYVLYSICIQTYRYVAAASTRRHSHHPIRARRKEMFGGMAPKRITMFNDVVPQRKAKREEKGENKQKEGNK